MMPVEEWDSYVCPDEDDPSEYSWMGPDDPDDWLSEADELCPKE